MAGYYKNRAVLKFIGLIRIIHLILHETFAIINNKFKSKFMIKST